MAGKLIEQKVERIAPDEWPPVPRFNTPTVVLDQKFQPAFRSAFDCASEDTSRPEINSVYLDVEDPKAHYVVATDGRHLFAANSFAFDLPKSIALPTRKFLSWKGVLEDGQWRVGFKDAVKGPKGIIKEHGSVIVQTDNWTFITKAIEAEYPKWKNVLPNPKRNKTTISLPPEPVALLLDIVLRIPGVNAQNQPLVLETNGRKFCIKGRNEDQEKWTVIPVEGAIVNGPAITVHINRTFLLKALRFGLTEIELSDPLDKVVFWGTGRKMIIMPLNPNPQTTAVKTTPKIPATDSSTVAEKEPTDEERTSMPKTTNRVEQHVQSSETTETKSAFEQLEGQIEDIKTKLKGVVSDMNEVLKTVTQAANPSRTSLVLA